MISVTFIIRVAGENIDTSSGVYSFWRHLAGRPDSLDSWNREADMLIECQRIIAESNKLL